jgi:hypothetical protein
LIDCKSVKVASHWAASLKKTACWEKGRAGRKEEENERRERAGKKKSSSSSQRDCVGKIVFTIHQFIQECWLLNFTV